MNKVYMQILNEKEVLTVKEVASLLDCSVRTVYRKINKGHLKAVNLSYRLTRIKRSDIDSIISNMPSKGD
ncbi:helix-turn-helix domain-containing protein [Galbibacter orientalis]|uniref:helix-turn-helix transcriptional regulator n=1 Tax=Galbibacter orientalis TaxID=453852 RepID=UPI003001DD2C